MDLRSAKKKALFCSKQGHRDQQLCYYAPKSGQLICPICALEDDIDGGTVPIADAAKQEREELKEWLRKVDGNIQLLGNQQQQVDGYQAQVEASYKETEAELDEAVERLKFALDERREELLQRLEAQKAKQLASLGTIAASIQKATKELQNKRNEVKALLDDIKEVELLRTGGSLRNKPLPSTDLSAMAQLQVATLSIAYPAQWANKALLLEHASLIGSSSPRPPGSPIPAKAAQHRPQSPNATADPSTAKPSSLQPKSKPKAAPVTVQQTRAAEPAKVSAAKSATTAETTQPVTLTTERCTFIQTPDGLKLEDLRGELTVTLFSSSDVVLKMATECKYDAFSWKPHGNMDGDIFTTSRTLQVKKGGTTFPLKRPLSLLKWKLADPAFDCPLHLMVEHSGSRCIVSFHATFPYPVQLTDIVVTVPLLEISKAPTTRCSVGTAQGTSKEVRWEIPSHNHYPSDYPVVESLDIRSETSFSHGPVLLQAQSTASLSGHGLKDILVGPEYTEHIPFKVSNQLTIEHP